ncbi:MAG: ribulose-phosphate 3-epimerase [Candidatus Brocadiia bacterium]
MRIRIAPSILSGDFANLAGQVLLVEQGGADYIHVDVMDGHFVPNITMGPVVVEALRRSTRLPLDVHLMIAAPDFYAPAFAKAGADICTIHIEVLKNPADSLRAIRDLGMKPGITLNPDTPVESILPYLELVDQVLIMSVFPGFSGQSFIPEVLAKATRVRNESRGLTLDVEIDGGINLKTVGDAVRAGANVLVAATAVFKQPDVSRACRELRASAEAAAQEVTT